MLCRPQSVRLDHNTSSTHVLNAGVPQGSMLSPLLYSSLQGGGPAPNSSLRLSVLFGTFLIVVRCLINNTKGVMMYDNFPTSHMTSHVWVLMIHMICEQASSRAVLESSCCKCKTKTSSAYGVRCFRAEQASSRAVLRSICRGGCYKNGLTDGLTDTPFPTS